MTRIAVFGANGRMGRTLIRRITADEQLQLVGAATEPGHETVGWDAGLVAGLPEIGLTVTDDLSEVLDGADVAIDFTLPVATAGNVLACAEHNVAIVIGTTGLSAEDFAELDRAARAIPVLYGRNMSVGINLLSELVRLAGESLGEDFDIEITEAHHRHKVDAPSGTALQLGEAAATGRNVDFDSAAVYERHGIGQPRAAGSIGFAAVRAGSIVGDHSVMFASDEEIVELRHRALDRAVFARGAIRAAAWLVGREPGRYSLRDVLGL